MSVWCCFLCRKILRKDNFVPSGLPLAIYSESLKYEKTVVQQSGKCSLGTCTTVSLSAVFLFFALRGRGKQSGTEQALRAALHIIPRRTYPPSLPFRPQTAGARPLSSTSAPQRRGRVPPNCCRNVPQRPRLRCPCGRCSQSVCQR